MKREKKLKGEKKKEGKVFQAKEGCEKDWLDPTTSQAEASQRAWQCHFS